MNMNDVIYKNILASDYFRRGMQHITTFEEAVDEIYNKVGHMSPTINREGEPSTGFCLIFRLFCFRLNETQMMTLLNHRDSPYIRAIGFLYLRYTSPPTEILEWFWNYLHDEEPIAIKMGDPLRPDAPVETMPMGKFVRQLLTEVKYFNTRFPRIPFKVEQKIQDELKKNPYTPVVDPAEEAAAAEAAEKAKAAAAAAGGGGGGGGAAGAGAGAAVDSSSDRRRDDDRRDRDRDHRDRDRDHRDHRDR